MHNIPRRHHINFPFSGVKKNILEFVKSLQLVLTLWARIQIDVINFLHDQNLKESQIILENNCWENFQTYIDLQQITFQCIEACDTVTPLSARIKI